MARNVKLGRCSLSETLLSLGKRRVCAAIKMVDMFLP